MSARRRHFVIETNTPAKVLLVRGHHAGDLCREAGMKPLWSPSGKGWCLDLHRLPDVAALCEWQNIAYRITEAGSAA
jgi:hypothetical protein